MAAIVLRPARPAVWPVVLAALAALGLAWSGQRPAADGPGEASFVRLDGWGLPELLRHLEARGLGLHALPTFQGGSLDRSAYLTVPGKSLEEVKYLVMDPGRIHRWTGVVFCEDCPRLDARNLEVLGTDCSLRVGPFIFFGDRDLLARIRGALLDRPG